MDYCVNCIYWDQAEEECSISEMVEYDSEEFFRLCYEGQNGGKP